MATVTGRLKAHTYETTHPKNVHPKNRFRSATDLMFSWSLSLASMVGSM